MIPVKQISEASCFLACLESFLKDHNIQTKQEDMIKMLMPIGLRHNNGWVESGKERKVCEALNELPRSRAARYRETARNL